MIIKIDTNEYNLDAILAASYRFIDRYYVSHRYAGETDIEVGFTTKKETDLHDLEAEYMEALESASMYIEMDKTNNKYRKYIVGQSLFSLANEQYMAGEQLQDASDGPSTSNEGSADDDPLEIAVPWEEKYGDKME